MLEPVPGYLLGCGFVSKKQEDLLIRISRSGASLTIRFPAEHRSLLCLALAVLHIH